MKMMKFGFSIDWSNWEWNWTLNDQSSIAFHVGICLFYAVSVKLAQLAVGDSNYSKLPWFDTVRKFHNISLAAVSFIMFVVMTYVIVMDGRLASWQAMACQMTPMRGIYGFINFVYLISKLWEWCDTLFLITSKKPVIFLHWFHHMTTFTMAALTHNFPVGGFALLNCLVHTVMYWHYASPIRWARPFITFSQLLQFVIVISIHVYGFLNPTTCYDMKPVFYEWLFCFVVVFGFFVMFVLFFIDEYISKESKNGKKKA